MLRLLCLIILAQISIPIQIVDFNNQPPHLWLYSNSTRTFTIQLQNYGASVDGSGYAPYFYISPNSTNKSPVVGTCSWSTTNTAIMTATFTSNNLPVGGKWIYGCGISNLTTGAITTFQQGQMDIVQDPWR